jgi:hypothetical protein
LIGIQLWRGHVTSIISDGRSLFKPGEINSRTLGDLAMLSHEELLLVMRAACCGRHREFQPDQPRLFSRSKGDYRPNAGRRPKGDAQRIRLSLTVARLTKNLPVH